MNKSALQQHLLDAPQQPKSYSFVERIDELNDRYNPLGLADVKKEITSALSDLIHINIKFVEACREFEKTYHIPVNKESPSNPESQVFCVENLRGLPQPAQKAANDLKMLEDARYMAVIDCWEKTAQITATKLNADFIMDKPPAMLGSMIRHMIDHMAVHYKATLSLDKTRLAFVYHDALMACAAD